MRTRSSPLPRAGRAGRSAAATAETAIVLPVLLWILFGVWEVGRLVHVQQMISNSARESARQASLGLQPASTAHNKVPAADYNYFVQRVAINYLFDAGLPLKDMTATVTNVTRNVSAMVTANDDFAPTNYTGTTPSMDPCLAPTDTPPGAAERFDVLRADVTYKWSSVRWSPLQYFVPSGTILRARCEWRCLRDEPLTANTNVPISPVP